MTLAARRRAPPLMTPSMDRPFLRPLLIALPLLAAGGAGAWWWSTRTAPEATPDPLSNAVGHLVFEVDALRAAVVTLHVGDRITRIGGVEVDHRVLALEDRAPYAGRFWHRYAVFGPERAASG